MNGAEEVAKEKSMSPAERLAAEIKANGVKRKRSAGPVYWFPQNTLEKERKRLGLNVNQAATGAGVGASSLSGMEKGENTNLAYAMRVAMFYDKPIEKLFGPVVLRTEGDKDPVAQNETAEIPTAPLPFPEEDGDPE